MLAPAALAPKEPNHATKNGPGLVKGLLQPPNARVDFRIRHDVEIILKYEMCEDVKAKAV